MYEAIKPLESLDLNGLVRLWAHEGLRLFADRLVTPEERQWTGTLLDSIAQESFPAVDVAVALKRPILFSDWLSKYYVPVEQEQLRDYIRARLRVFYEEELDVPLVLFNDLLEHVLRIDRVFKQVQGHLLLIGVSGAGKEAPPQKKKKKKNTKEKERKKKKLMVKNNRQNYAVPLCRVAQRPLGLPDQGPQWLHDGRL